MQNTNTILHRPTTAGRSPQKHIVMLGLVGAIHVAAIYALVAGLLPGIVHPAGPGTIDVVPMPPDATPKNDPLPDPKDTFVIPQLPTADMPDVPIQSDTGSTISVMRGADRTFQPTTPPTSALSIGGTHTIPPYPEMSIRLQEHGTVTLRLAVGADGTVNDAVIVTSSGSERLDQAAVAWVKAHWRYKPATLEGAPVASAMLAAVKFDLKNAR